MKSSDELKVYSSNFRCDVTLLEALYIFFHQIISFKKHIFSIIKKDMKSKYKQDTFGMLWSLVLPVIPMTVYMLLASIKVFKTSENMPFIFYIAMGMTVWLLMTSIIKTVMNSLRNSKNILIKMDFPISIVYATSIGEILFETLIRLLVVTGIMLWYQIGFNILDIFLMFILLIPAIIISFGIGIFLSLIDVVLPDTRKIIDMFFRYGLFASSVIFPFPDEGILGIINNINIFNTFVITLREALFYGSISHSFLYVTSTLISLFFILFIIKQAYKMEYKIRTYL